MARVTRQARLGRRELNKIQTRQALLGAAKELFNEVGAFPRVGEIAERAQVSRATFFNYFPSKDDLLRGLYDELVAELDTIVAGLLDLPLTTTERVRAVFGDFAGRAVGDDPYLLTFTVELERAATLDQADERTQHLTDLFAALLERGVEQGEVRGDHPVDFLALMVVGIYLAAMRAARSSGNPGDFATSFAAAGEFAASAVTARP